jgi:hypothetical protein
VQLPAWHVSFEVHAFPSSQLVPLAFGLHPVVLVVGVHTWHALPGVTVPAATHAPAMRQLSAAQQRPATEELSPTQFPLTQSVSALQDFPLISLLPQLLLVLRQVSFTQSVSVVQVARHVTPPLLHL